MLPLNSGRPQIVVAPPEGLSEITLLLNSGHGEAGEQLQDSTAFDRYYNALVH